MQLHKAQLYPVALYTGFQLPALCYTILKITTTGFVTILIYKVFSPICLQKLCDS